MRESYLSRWYVIVQLDFKFINFEVAIKHVCNCTIMKHLKIPFKNRKLLFWNQQVVHSVDEVRIRWLFPPQGSKSPSKWSVLNMGMTLNSGEFGIISSFPLLPGPLRLRVVVPVRVKYICLEITCIKLLVLDENTWYHIIVCYLFVLRIVTLRYICLQRIDINYLKSYNCK